MGCCGGELLSMGGQISALVPIHLVVGEALGCLLAEPRPLRVELLAGHRRNSALDGGLSEDGDDLVRVRRADVLQPLECLWLDSLEHGLRGDTIERVACPPYGVMAVLLHPG